MKSIEEKIEDNAKAELKAAGVVYFEKTNNINSEIENALLRFPSKNGGAGGNMPDIKLLLGAETARRIPVMIEVKGRKGDLVKLDASGYVDLELTAPDKKNPEKKIVGKHANKFAVNGAIHYAKAILTLTQSYSEVIAIGVNGYEENGETRTEYGVYYISRDNFSFPQKIDDYTDLSFLGDYGELIRKIDALRLTDEDIERICEEVEDQIEDALTVLNQVMHDKHQISENYRVRLVVGMVMAGLNGLVPSDLKSENEEQENDGSRFMSAIVKFLGSKQLPSEKRKAIITLMNEVFPLSQLWRPVNGESHLKQIFLKVVAEILPYFQNNKHHLDFTGKLFNVLNRWVDIPDNAKNDVVLTPRYVCEFMARLCRTNKDSYVWDYAMGTGGFLISAMKIMLRDCKQSVKSPAERTAKETKIKTEQLLGIEILPDIYVLAILNMILMNDGSANVLNNDSLTEFDGNYAQGGKKGEKFPATVFLLNPPYSAPGKGLNFVKKALDRMASGYAAVLIQENAGSGKGDGYGAEILKHSSLIASIKMPGDLFIGKSSVQTAIYMFKVGEPHDAANLVKFIDFSIDGYARQNRRKSSAKVNLRDTGDVKGRYAEVLDIVLGRKTKTDYYKDLTIEDTISLNGTDWTYGQHQKIDTRPTEADFRKTVADYLSWKIGSLIKAEGTDANFP